MAKARQRKARKSTSQRPSFENDRKESLERLQAAKKLAERLGAYDSRKARGEMARMFSDVSRGKVARDWQLDQAETLMLGIDSVLVAGTGAGKTLPYMLPLLLPENRGKMIVVISPLKSLQRDQVSQFSRSLLECLLIATRHQGKEVSEDGDKGNCNQHGYLVRSNREGVHKSIKPGAYLSRPQKIRALEYQAIFISPEMCFKNPKARDTIAALGLEKNILALVVDEAHCISQWGGDFRPSYAELDKLRALLPGTIPVMATSATLTPTTLKDVTGTLKIDVTKMFYTNLGNDRPNIKMEVITMANTMDFSALDHILNLGDVQHPADIPKTIIFANERNDVMSIWQYIRSRLEEHLQYSVDYMHAFRGDGSKQRSMRWFLDGQTRILVATEAVGMVSESRRIVLALLLMIH